MYIYVIMRVIKITAVMFLCFCFAIVFPQERINNKSQVFNEDEYGCLTILGADGVELSVVDIVEYILGEGVTYSNIRYQGILGDATEASIGYFEGGDCVPLQFDEGIIISTGTVGNALGPNELAYTSANLGLPGDPDLDELVPGYSTFDATWIEFDFIPDNSEIFIQYVFGSEEYNQFVGESYNDVFGFFVNGENIALIPGTDIPVSIINVNNGQAPEGQQANGPCTNCEYFIDNANINDPLFDIECDGMTTLLYATAEVNIGVVNTIKLAIADAGDALIDSWVFIKAESFTTLPPVLPQVQTLDPLDVTNNTAIIRGEVTFGGNSDIIDRGFYWSSDESSVMQDLKIELGPGNLLFEAQIENLDPYTDYYYVAYAENVAGRAYGDIVSFTTLDILPLIPNAFMPSGNIVANQTFKPLFSLEPEAYTLKIFNRWGSMVFKSNQPDEGWDGQYNGSDAPAGGYIYKLNYTDHKGIKQEHKGIVMLIR